jgi:hypothetical protein
MARVWIWIGARTAREADLTADLTRKGVILLAIVDVRGVVRCPVDNCVDDWGRLEEYRESFGFNLSTSLHLSELLAKWTPLIGLAG